MEPCYSELILKMSLFFSKVKIKPEPEDDYDDYYDTGNYDNYMENNLEVELKENIKDEKNVLLQDKKPVIKRKKKRRTRNSDPDPIGKEILTTGD